MTGTPEAGRQTLWVGWVVFAGLVMFAGGVLNLIQGFVALFDESYYHARSDLLVDVGYQAWGWTMLVVGAVVAVSGYALLGGRAWAAWVAVVVMAFDILVNFVFVAGYPFWSILAIALDIIVIYALVVHGREIRGPTP